MSELQRVSLSVERRAEMLVSIDNFADSTRNQTGFGFTLEAKPISLRGTAALVLITSCYYTHVLRHALLVISSMAGSRFTSYLPGNLNELWDGRMFVFG